MTESLRKKLLCYFGEDSLGKQRTKFVIDTVCEWLPSLLLEIGSERELVYNKMVIDAPIGSQRKAFSAVNFEHIEILFKKKLEELGDGK